MGKGIVVVVVKEREMEIGYPTDVKHVAHIGLDGLSGTAPGWVCCLLFCMSFISVQYFD